MSDGEITSTPAGLSMDIDIDKPTAPSSTTATIANPFMEKVAPEFTDKQWVKDLAKHSDPWNELLRQHENVQTLASRKADGLKVPGETATADDWKAFHKAIGVPDNLDDYKYEAPTVPEHLKEYFAQDDELLSAMRKAAQEAGLTPAGFKKLAAGFDAYYLDQLEKSVNGANDAVAKLENDFKAKYGDRSGAVLENWQNLSKMAPEWTQPVLEQLPDVAKVAMAAWADAVSSKYINEGKLDLDVPATAAAGPMTWNEYGDQYEVLFAQLRSSRPGSPEYVQAKQKIDSLRAKVDRIQK